MSRYVCHYALDCAPERVRPILRHLLAACQLEPIHETKDFIVAREIPGHVPFARLVKVEVLLDITHASGDRLKLSFVFKNEELPLNSNNHCRQVFDLLRRTIDSAQPTLRQAPFDRASWAPQCIALSEPDCQWQPIATLHADPNPVPLQPYLDHAPSDLAVPILDPQWSASVN